MIHKLGFYIYTGFEIPAVDKHSSLFGPFISFSGSYLLHYIYFITYKWAQYVRELHVTLHKAGKFY